MTRSWDSPTYSASYDSSKTEFSVTVPGSALGRVTSNVMIQAGDIGVNVTVKAVGFAEDARATADITLDLPANLQNGRLHRRQHHRRERRIRGSTLPTSSA